VYFRRYDRRQINTDGQIDRVTDTLITILRSSIGGGVKIAAVVVAIRTASLLPTRE